MKTVKLERPDPIEFFLPDGRSFIVAPVTRGRMREALSLDPEQGEVRGPVQAAAQRSLQLAALVGEAVGIPTPEGNVETHPSAPFLAELTPEEEIQVLNALTAQGHGQDPTAAVGMHALAKKKAGLEALNESPLSTGTPSNSPSSLTDLPGKPSSSDSSIV